MKKLGSILTVTATIFIFGCDDSSNSSKARNNNNTSTEKNLTELKPGSGGKCFEYAYTEAYCAENKEALNDQNNSQITPIAPVRLEANEQGKSKYVLEKPSVFEPELFKNYADESLNQPKDQLLVEYIKPQFYDFLQYISKGDINASGEIQQFEMDVEGEITPVKYVFDCNENVNTVQVEVGESHLKLTNKVLEDGILESTLEKSVSTNSEPQVQKKFCKATGGSFKGAIVPVIAGKEDDDKVIDPAIVPSEDKSNANPEHAKEKIDETLDNAKEKAVETEQDIKAEIDKAAKDTKNKAEELAGDINKEIEKAQAEDNNNKGASSTVVIPPVEATNGNKQETNQSQPKNSTPIRSTLTEEQRLDQKENQAEAQANQAEKEAQAAKTQAELNAEAAKQAEADADIAESVAKKAQQDADKLKSDASRAKEREVQAKETAAKAKENQADATEKEADRIETQADVAEDRAEEAKEDEGFWGWLTGIFN